MKISTVNDENYSMSERDNNQITEGAFSKEALLGVKILGQRLMPINTCHIFTQAAYPVPEVQTRF